jgi:hypothetical protein
MRRETVGLFLDVLALRQQPLADLIRRRTDIAVAQVAGDLYYRRVGRAQVVQNDFAISAEARCDHVHERPRRLEHDVGICAAARARSACR